MHIGNALSRKHIQVPVGNESHQGPLVKLGSLLGKPKLGQPEAKQCFGVEPVGDLIPPSQTLQGNPHRPAFDADFDPEQLNELTQQASQAALWDAPFRPAANFCKNRLKVFSRHTRNRTRDGHPRCAK